MKNKPTKQHYVPQCYLRAFATKESINNKEPLIWIFPKAERKGRLDKIKNVLFAKDLYTLDIGGKKDYSIETSLANVEAEYTKVYREKIEKRLPLSKREHMVLCVFITALMQRTLRHKDSVEGFLSEVIEKMEKLDEAHNTHSKIVDDYKKLKANSHKLGIFKILPDLADVLIKMNLAFMCTDETRPGYITCDDPCIMFNPDLQWQRFYGYGLAQKSIELTITLSPTTMAVFSWQNLRGYIKTTSSRVQDHNRMVRHHAYKYFLLNEPRTNFIWFSKYPLSLKFMFRVLKHKVGEMIFRIKYLWKMRNY
ncbi:DUF4238 domain-containing protein [Candidatus Shapirobacteria bacterium]|nr:DUF4238 domain-containing protein [Candidatus Shapirobacteria bacterium]MBM3283381.1 DUF4238 domain-containing protein [Candidatus Gottesmanbacteria bacterium]